MKLFQFTCTPKIHIHIHIGKVAKRRKCFVFRSRFFLRFGFPLIEFHLLMTPCPYSIYIPFLVYVKHAVDVHAVQTIGSFDVSLLFAYFCFVFFFVLLLASNNKRILRNGCCAYHSHLRRSNPQLTKNVILGVVDAVVAALTVATASNGQHRKKNKKNVGYLCVRCRWHVCVMCCAVCMGTEPFALNSFHFIFNVKYIST